MRRVAIIAFSQSVIVLVALAVIMPTTVLAGRNLGATTIVQGTGANGWLSPYDRSGYGVIRHEGGESNWFALQFHGAKCSKGSPVFTLRVRADGVTYRTKVGRIIHNGRSSYQSNYIPMSDMALKSIPAGRYKVRVGLTKRSIERGCVAYVDLVGVYG